MSLTMKKKTSKILKKNNQLALDDADTLLPGEIIFLEIFPRLPVKSLHRFRCVSKTCRSLTSHPAFLAAFRSHSADRYVLSFISGCDMKSVFYYSKPESRSESIKQNSDRTCYTDIKFINGFVCLVRGTQVIIRKIGTNEQLLLPPPFWFAFPMDRQFFYFCHDPETDKYKVLRTCVGDSAYIDIIVISRSFSVFTLAVDKSWRNFPQPGLCQLGKSTTACVDGVLFCNNFSTGSNIEDGVIAAYVVREEYFDVVRYPQRLSPSRYSSCHLTNVKGSIAVVDVQDLRGCVMRLWVKVQGFRSKSWLEHRIEVPPPLENIFNVSCNFSFTTNRGGEIVIGLAGLSTAGDACWVFCHNMETGKWRRIDMVGIEPRDVIFADFVVEEYVETPLLMREVLKPRYNTRQWRLN